MEDAGVSKPPLAEGRSRRTAPEVRLEGRQRRRGRAGAHLRRPGHTRPDPAHPEEGQGGRLKTYFDASVQARRGAGGRAVRPGVRGRPGTQHRPDPGRGRQPGPGLQHRLRRRRGVRLHDEDRHRRDDARQGAGPRRRVEGGAETAAAYIGQGRIQMNALKHRLDCGHRDGGRLPAAGGRPALARRPHPRPHPAAPRRHGRNPAAADGRSRGHGLRHTKGAKTGSAKVDGQGDSNAWFTAYAGDLAAAALANSGSHGGDSGGEIVACVLDAR